MSTGLSVLGIDTSCYTTSAALARDGEIVAFERRLLPVPGGERGLRQSEADFAHVKQLPDVLSAVLTAGPVGAVSVSVKPTDAEESYMPVFACGRSFARSIAAALHVPLFETTHQRGHIRAAMIGTDIHPGDMLAVHLSGGTTDVLLVEKGKITAMGSSLDLHAGQLVDRVGVSMDLSFPAGPALEKLAMQSKGAGSRLKASIPGACPPPLRRRRAPASARTGCAAACACRSGRNSSSRRINGAALPMRCCGGIFRRPWPSRTGPT